MTSGPATAADPPLIASIACRSGTDASSRHWASANSRPSSESAPMEIAAGSSMIATGHPASARLRSSPASASANASVSVRLASAGPSSARLPSEYGPGSAWATARSVSAAVARQVSAKKVGSAPWAAIAETAAIPDAARSWHRTWPSVTRSSPASTWAATTSAASRSVASCSAASVARPAVTSASSASRSTPSWVTLGHAPCTIANITADPTRPRPSARCRPVAPLGARLMRVGINGGVIVQETAA